MCHPTHPSIGEWFRETARANGDRVALEYREGAITFSELNERSERIAHWMYACVGDSKRVLFAVLPQESPEYVACLLGALKAGILFTSLPVHSSASELASALESAGPSLVLTDPENFDSICARLPKGLEARVLDSQLPGFTHSLPVPDPRAPAILTFTSGSTGRPKGIVHSNFSMNSFISAYAELLGITESDRVAVLRGAQGTDLIRALLTGATSVLYNLKEEGMVGLGDWLNSKNISLLPATPTMLKTMMAFFPENFGISCVRLLRMSGEPLSMSELEALTRYFPEECEVVNWYGSTEVGVSCNKFRLADRTAWRSGSVGRTLPGIEVSVINDEGVPVEAGETGEVVVYSHALFECYWRQPELEKPVLEVLDPATNLKSFKTGDLGRIDNNGELVLLGRKDWQLNYRGYRIEPEEIEIQMNAIPGIKASAVRLAKNNTGSGNSDELVAFIELEKDAAPSVEFIRERLIKALAAHKVPSFFARLDPIPRLSSGKIDRRSLPAFTPRTRVGYN